MGKFDGVLLCSDIDGTLRTGERTQQAFEKNREAIEYFKAQGGTFTIVTGRNRDYLKGSELLELTNAPVGLLNGAMAYDFGRDRPIHISWLPYTLGELETIADGFEGSVCGVTPFFCVAGQAETLTLPIEERFRGVHPFKAVFKFDDADEALAFRDKARRDKRFDGCFFARSWPFGVECINARSTKAHLMNVIKKATGCRYTVAIGDYDNDVPMIEAADLGAAVDGGAECVTKAADRTVCACEDGAVAELIYSL